MVLEKVEGMVEETAVEMADTSHTVLAWERVAVRADKSNKEVLEEREKERVEVMVDRLSKEVLEEMEEERVVTGMWNMVAAVDKGMAQDMVAEDWDKGKNR